MYAQNGQFRLAFHRFDRCPLPLVISVQNFGDSERETYFLDGVPAMRGYCVAAACVFAPDLK